MTDKEHLAISRLQAASEMSLHRYKQPLVVTTSGGKDSSVCVELAIRAGIPFEVQHNHTTADAPETVRFVRSEFKRLEELGIKCTVNLPAYKGHRTSMWALIREKGTPPTRLIRYCCEVLKEHGGDGRFICTGVRWAESPKRKNTRGQFELNNRIREKQIILTNDNDPERRLFESCQLKAKRTVNPIIDWTDEDVWDFIGSEHIPMNPLYGCGFRRVGCIGCPVAGKGRYAEFARYPKYQDAYIRAFDRMLEARRAAGKKELPMWHDARDVFRWWMEDGNVPGQMEMEDYL